MNERSLISHRGVSGPDAGSTRQQILAAAAHVLRQRGLVGMTTRAITRQAGLADGTLYVHFPHKEDLLLATFEAALPRFDPVASAHTADHRSLQATLEDVVRTVVQYTVALVPVSGALFSDPELLARLQTSLSERHVGAHALVRHVAEYLVSEQQRGRIKGRFDPLGVAALVVGPCFQYAFERQLLGAQAHVRSEDQFIADLVQTLYTCLSRRRGKKARAREGARRAHSDRLA